jgi:hypothetical protein
MTSRDFIQKLWAYFESNDPRQEQKALSAMRILGKAFVSEKVENTQVETLKIAGNKRRSGTDARRGQLRSPVGIQSVRFG